jgi:hypothetical protein
VLPVPFFFKKLLQSLAESQWKEKIALTTSSTQQNFNFARPVFRKTLISPDSR